MIGGNVTHWGQWRIDPEIDALLGELHSQIENDVDPQRRLEFSLKCFAEIKKLATRALYGPNQPLKADAKYPWIDALLKLAEMVDPSKPVRKQIIDQAFDWMSYAEQHDYAALSARRLIYYWLRRADKSVVDFDPGQFSADFDARDVFTDEELNDFYRDNQQLVHRAMMRDVYPARGVLYAHPFSDQSAKIYFEYYEKLLQVAHGERVLEQPQPLLA